MTMFDWFFDTFVDVMAATADPALCVAFLLLVVNTFISLIFGGRSKLLIRYERGVK